VLKFSEPIDEKRRNEIVDAIAKKIKQFGMLVPAIFFLEMHKPFSYIGGQAMHFFAPVVGVFFDTFEDYAYFFDDRQNVELLIQRLEALAMEEEDERKKQKALKSKSRKQDKAESSMLDDALKMEPDEEESDHNNN